MFCGYFCHGNLILAGEDSKGKKKYVPLAEVYPLACRITHKKSSAIPPIRYSGGDRKEQKSSGRQVADYNGK